MSKIEPTREDVLNAIRSAALASGRAPSRRQFQSASDLTERQVVKHFSSWNDAVRAAGFEPDTSRKKINDDVLLKDYGRDRIPSGTASQAAR